MVAVCIVTRIAFLCACLIILSNYLMAFNAKAVPETDHRKCWRICGGPRRASREKQNGSRNADDWSTKARSGSLSAIRIARADDWREWFSSGAAQVSELTALIDRYAGGLDSVPIDGHGKCDVSFGLLERNDLVNLAFEDIEQTAISVRRERSEKDSTLGKHRITQAVEAGAAMGRLSGADYQFRGSMTG